MVKLKTAKRRFENPDRICNICGYSVEKYQIIDNAPICDDCVPLNPSILNTKKQKIPNENQMLTKILEKESKK